LIFAKAKIEIFETKTTLSRPKVNVHLAALKIIELLSIQQIEEFYLYQWVFMFDCKVHP
jgi:hypothetical protein